MAKNQEQSGCLLRWLALLSKQNLCPEQVLPHGGWQLEASLQQMFVEAIVFFSPEKISQLNLMETCVGFDVAPSSVKPQNNLALSGSRNSQGSADLLTRIGNLSGSPFLFSALSGRSWNIKNRKMFHQHLWRFVGLSVLTASIVSL